MKRFLILLLLPLLFLSCAKQQSENSDFKNYKDLEGHSMAVVLGSLHDVNATEQTQSATILRLASPAEVIAAVSHGKADAGIIDEAVSMCLDTAQYGIKLVPFEGPRFDIAFAFNLNNTALKADFDDFFLKAKASGTIKQITDRWTISHPEEAEMPQIELTSTEKPLDVAIMFGDMPFSFVKNNELVGLEVEILKRWAEAKGHQLNFINYEFGSMIAALQTGKVDMLSSCIFVTPERKEKVLFSEPYMACGTVCVQPTNTQVAQVSFWEKLKTAFVENVIKEQRWKMLLEGLWQTVIIAFWSLVFGTLLGCALCYCRMRKNIFCRGFAKVYVDLMRGIPILVFLMILFYVIFATSGMSATWIAIIAFSCNFAAYVSEMFRSGIESVDKGQYEAGWAMGFSKVKTFFLIIFPQSLRHILPVYKGEAVSLIKNTSIVGYIAIQDLTKVSDIIRSRTFDAFFPLLIITVMYFILAWILGLLLDRIKVK